MPEPPAGLSPQLAGAYVQSAPPKRAVGRAAVVAVVAVLGVLLASGVVGVGYKVMTTGGLALGSATPGVAAPAPAARTSPLAPKAGETDTAQDTSGSGATAPGTIGAGRKPGASPDIDPIYLDAMRQRPAFRGFGDADLFALGASTCGRLDSGEALVKIWGSGGGRNLTVEDMGYVTGVTVVAYCTQHKPMLEKLIGEPLPSI
jgi:hypothetical protein